MHSRPVGVLFACLLLVTASSAVAAVGTTAGETTISGVEAGGMGFVTVEGNTTFVWQAENATVDVTVTTGNISEPNHEVCVRAPSLETGQQKLGCKHERLESNTTTTISVPVSGWPDAATGSSLSLEITLRKALTDTVVNKANASVTVIAKDGQFDGDQLSNEREVELGTKISAQDTDDDGLWDGQEADSVGSSPLSKDTDGDGVRDAVEVNYGTNATLDDTDTDGLSDDAELNQYSTDPLEHDSDGDGLSDGREVHELNSSPSEATTDADGLDDGTELELGTGPDNPDSDGDGLTDGEEYNRYDTNPLESDTDGDGLADALEVQLGTSPASVFSPWGYVVVLVGAGVLVGTQLYRTGWRVRRERRAVGGRSVRVPTVTRVDERSESKQSTRSESIRHADSESVQSPSGTVGSGDAASAAPGGSGTSARGGQTEAGAGGSPDGRSGGANDQTGEANDQSGGANGQSGVPEEAFLTDADRVTELLEAAGGNCRQQDIVRKTGWSKSKVSRLLSQMADDDEVRKISLGRENIIVLPGEEPDAVRSALDDE